MKWLYEEISNEAINLTEAFEILNNMCTKTLK